MIAEELGGGEFGHGADAGDGVHLAVLRADEYGRFAAESEVRELDYAGGQHGGDAGIHGIAAVVEDPHAGFGGVLRSTGHRTVGAPRCQPHRPFAPLRLLSQNHHAPARQPKPPV